MKSASRWLRSLPLSNEGFAITNMVFWGIHLQLYPMKYVMTSINSNNSENGRLDIAAGNFWQEVQKAYLDFWIFNTFAQWYNNQILECSFTFNDKEKNRMYNAMIINIEHGFYHTTYLYIIWSGREAKRCIRKLANLLVVLKRDL